MSYKHESAPPQYLQQAKIEESRASNDQLRSFFKAFHESLSCIHSDNYNSSDKNYLPRALKAAIRHILPDVEVPLKERPFSAINVFKELPKEASFFLRKSPDYIFENKATKKIVILELKTNISFNDFSAALVQMSLIKKMMQKSDYGYYMASVHLADWKRDIDRYRWMNAQYENALDDIWVFSGKEAGKASELKFDVEAISRFGNKIVHFLNG